jgi:hypothetical protein
VKSQWVFVREGEGEWPAGEVNERERGRGGVEPAGAPDEEFHLVVERLRSGVRSTSGRQDAVQVVPDPTPPASQSAKARLRLGSIPFP